jgi:hypothetical protein
MRIFDCVILSWWGEMGLLEKRFQAFKDNPDVTHVICEAAAGPDGKMKPVLFPDSELATAWRGRWNHVRVEPWEIRGKTPQERESCLREYLLHGFNGEPDDLIMIHGIGDIPDQVR